MPNQRDPDKELLGGYVHKDLKKQVEKAATAEDKTLSEMLEEFVRDGVARYKRRKNGKKGLTVFNTFGILLGHEQGPEQSQLVGVR